MTIDAPPTKPNNQKLFGAFYDARVTAMSGVVSYCATSCFITQTLTYETPGIPGDSPHRSDQELFILAELYLLGHRSVTP